MKYDTIIVASGNRHKIEEIKKIFKGVNLVSMRDAGFCGDIEENGSTFKENAYIKAQAVCKALNLPALSDDSGLCVDALGGAPGIYSARFSGGDDKANRQLLLRRLDGVKDRRAHFECAVCLATPDGEVFYGSGSVNGSILADERGENGFGYDSLFYCDELKKSFAEATDGEKNSVSHRSRALQDLWNKL